MKVSSVSDYSWLYSLMNNTGRIQTATSQTTAAAQQVSGIANVDGDTFTVSGAGTSGGGLLVGTNDDSSALDLKSFLDKVANGTVTQEDLDAMQEQLSSRRAAAAPPPPQGQSDEEDSIKAFLDKVAAGTVTDADLTATQSFLSQLTTAAANNAAADGTTSGGQQFTSQQLEAYDRTSRVS